MWRDTGIVCGGLVVGCVIGICIGMWFTWRYLYDAIKAEVDDEVTGRFEMPP